MAANIRAFMGPIDHALPRIGKKNERVDILLYWVPWYFLGMREFSPAKVPVPPDFRPLPLGKYGAVDVEIGCGVGFHPIRYALENPDRQLIAFERTKEKYAKFLGRLAGHPPLPNLVPVHGDAVAWIAHGLGPASVDRYFILYPNPYPKESQRNRRFHEMPFFSHLVKTLKVKGSLTLSTNVPALAVEARERITQGWGLSLEEETVVPATERPRTHFEKKYLARGDTCWNLIFRRE